MWFFVCQHSSSSPYLLIQLSSVNLPGPVLLYISSSQSTADSHAALNLGEVPMKSKHCSLFQWSWLHLKFDARSEHYFFESIFIGIKSRNKPHTFIIEEMQCCPSFVLLFKVFKFTWQTETLISTCKPDIWCCAFSSLCTLAAAEEQRLSKLQ